jgi:very-short-patch-repair endonuclease
MDICEVDGLAATTPARTLVDVAAEFGWSRYFHVVDKALTAGRPSLGEFIACYASLTRRGRKGAAKVTTYLKERTEPPVHDLSELEWLFEQKLLSSGLRLPVRQFRPPWYDGIRGIADYGIPDHRTIVELDGRSFHSTMQAFAEDRRRDRLARAHDWTTLRYAFEEIRHRGDEVLADLRPLLSGTVGVRAA